MYAQRLLPGEQRERRRHARVDEAGPEVHTPRSVRSIRERFEGGAPPPASASAPATPAKRRAPRTQTKTQAQLAAFLKAGSGAPGDPEPRKAAPQPNRPRVPSAREAVQNGSVGSLIEKFSVTARLRSSADRAPLQERDLQRVDDTAAAAPPPVQGKKPYVDSVDTFGSSSADFDPRAIPKTDPGPRLEPYSAQLSHGDPASPHLSAAAGAVATGDQNLKDMVARGVQARHAKESSRRGSRVSNTKDGNLAIPNESSVDARRRSGPATRVPPLPPTQQKAVQEAGAGPEQEQEQETGEESGPNDSDWGAGDVYIRELFAEAEDTAERAVQCDENEEYFEAFELYWVVVDLYYKVIPFLTPEEGGDVHERIKMYTRRCEAIREAFEDDPEGQDEIEVRIADASVVSAQKEEQIQESFNAWNAQGGEIFAKQEASPTGVDETEDEGRWPSKDIQNVEKEQPEELALARNRFPDFVDSKPLSSIPEAPRKPAAVAISASTQAHRNSLSRPISRSAVRASTSSVSRERVIEMQERVQVMQECLNNFTVKRKHLGPARALELHVTTLNANTFGDLKKLEPLAPELEHKWATELEVLLSMLQEIKEVRPGVGYGLRDDIARHLPALERCDRSVRTTMRSFSALSGHVQYVERETATSAKGGRSRRRWWVKVPVVASGGLPRHVYSIVEEAEKEMRGVFKVCHEINIEVVKSMPVPPSFVAALPKHARELIPKSLKEGLTTWGMFKVSDYMKDTNQYNKDSAKDLASRLEKVALIWEAKTNNKSFLSRTFDIRGEKFHQAVTAFRRCQNAIRDLRREWYVIMICHPFPQTYRPKGVPTQFQNVALTSLMLAAFIIFRAFLPGPQCNTPTWIWQKYSIMKTLDTQG